MLAKKRLTAKGPVPLAGQQVQVGSILAKKKLAAKKFYGKVGLPTSRRARLVPKISRRHLTKPASATEIRDALGLQQKDLDDATKRLAALSLNG